MKILVVTIIAAAMLLACNNGYTPLPRGYFRIHLPEKEYRAFDTVFPYGFNIPVYARVIPDTDDNKEPYWINIVFPQFNGTVHISYKEVKGNVTELMEDSRRLAYKHSVKADAIGEIAFNDQDRRIFGILYDIKGNAASPLQFAVTDSTSHFLRGSLYFNTTPNKDSLAPVIDFLKGDVMELMESVVWK